MTVPSKAWDQVNERLMALGTQVRKSADKVSKGAAADRAAFENSVRDMFVAIEDGFGLAAKAVRDPKIRKDLSNVAESVRKALSATMESASEQVRERLPGATGKRLPKSTGRKVAAPKPAARKAVAPKPAARKAVAVKKAAPARKGTAGRSTARRRTGS